jgi:hypothetical protein
MTAAGTDMTMQEAELTALNAEQCHLSAAEWQRWEEGSLGLG